MLRMWDFYVFHKHKKRKVFEADGKLFVIRVLLMTDRLGWWQTPHAAAAAAGSICLVGCARSSCQANGMCMYIVLIT